MLSLTAPTSSVEVQVFEERVDLSNDMTWRQMIAVGVRRVVLARGELDKLEGPKYAATRAELRVWCVCLCVTTLLEKEMPFGTKR